MKTRKIMLFSLILITIVLAIGITIFVSLNSPTGHVVKEDNVVRIGYTKFSFSIPLFVAIENGYFEEEGIEIELVNIEDNHSLLNGVISDQIDIASAVGSTVVFSAYKQDKESFRIIHSNFDIPAIPVSFLIVKSNSDITNLKDLKNKKIGVLPTNTHSQIIIKELLKQQGIAEEDVTLIDIAPQLQPQALEAGSVDAIYAFDPTATISLENFDTKILHTLDRTSIFSIDPYYGGSLIISTRFTKENPKTAIKTIKALDKAVDYVNSNDVESKLILAKYTPLDEELAPKLRGKFFFLKPEEINENILQRQANLFFDRGVIKDNVVVEGIVFK